MLRSALEHFSKSHLISKFALLSTLMAFSAKANVVGMDAQNFNPTSHGIGYVTMQPSQTLEPGTFNLGLFFNYAKNSLPMVNINGSKKQFTDAMTSMDSSFSMGILDNWDFGLTVPYLLKSQVDGAGNYPFFNQNGQTDFRLNTRIRLYHNERFGLGFVFSVNLPQVQNSPYLGVNPGPIYNYELVADTKIGDTRMAINAGYRKRNPGAVIPLYQMDPFGDQILASLGLGHPIFNDKWDIIGEIWWSNPIKNVNSLSSQEIATLEGILGLKWLFLPTAAWHVGGGSRLMNGNASPDYRIYTGLNWTFGPIWGNSEKTQPYQAPVQSEVIAQEPSSIPEEPITELVAPVEQKPVIVEIDNDKDALNRESTAPVETLVTRQINFDTNSTVLKPQYYEVLAQIARYVMKGDGFDKLIVKGHTDSQGSDSYNLDLSQRRAEAVRKVLLKVTKVKSSKISAEGLGETQPVATNQTAEGRAQNRRVEFVVYRKGAAHSF